MSNHTERLLQLIDGYSGFSDATMRKDALDGIKSSELTAFYIPAFIIDAIAKEIHSLFHKHSITMRSFLGPSAGTCGFLPVAIAEAKTYAFEKDVLTGLVLSALQDQSQVIIDGYETISGQKIKHKTFDVIASNIPFGNFSVFDAEMWKCGGVHKKSTKVIHNYFFVKSMELLNEGGLLIFITSRGVADTLGNKFVREYLATMPTLSRHCVCPTTFSCRWAVSK